MTPYQHKWVSQRFQRLWGRILSAYTLMILAGCSAEGDAARTDKIPKNERHIAGKASPPDRFETCKELLSWREKNEGEFHVRKASGDWRMDVEYRSPYCIACTELPEAALTDTGFVKRLGELDSSHQLVLRAMTATDSNFFAAEVLRTASSIHTLRDTIPCAFAHREIVPDMVPYRTYLLGFEGPERADEVITLRIEPGPTNTPWSFTFNEVLSEYLSTSAASAALDPSW